MSAAIFLMAADSQEKIVMSKELEKKVFMVKLSTLIPGEKFKIGEHEFIVLEQKDFFEDELI